MSSPDHSRCTVDSRAQSLVKRLHGFGSVAVAFSGGVDSAVVAKAAVIALNEKAVAVTAVSPSLARSELETARREAILIGIRHIELRTEEFSRPEYRRNAGDRCFFCKDTLYELTSVRLPELGVEVIVNGANTDDLSDHRPGMQAAIDHRVRSPLIEEGLNKKHVRELARHWNLSVAEKPASPCLSSRIAYGVEVTEERVFRVERGEAVLKSITGIHELRVRHEAHELARIEVPVEHIVRLLEHDLRTLISREFHALGFRAVTVDLDGFRSGSLNNALPLVQLQVGGPRS
ncbi:MAG: ATP-dependent sacrificial sulfur transferase LarE [Planctomycetaceae bacterium]